MKYKIILLITFWTLNINSQELGLKKRFKIDIKIINIDSNNPLAAAGTIVEVFSGSKRIDTGVSDFDGVSIFYLDSTIIKGDNINLRFHAVNCEVSNKKFILQNDLKVEIHLRHGETEYTSHKKLAEMYKKLKIKPNSALCGTLD